MTPASHYGYHGQVLLYDWFLTISFYDLYPHITCSLSCKTIGNTEDFWLNDNRAGWRNSPTFDFHLQKIQKLTDTRPDSENESKSLKYDRLDTAQIMIGFIFLCNIAAAICLQKGNNCIYLFFSCRNNSNEESEHFCVALSSQYYLNR